MNKEGVSDFPDTPSIYLRLYVNYTLLSYTSAVICRRKNVRAWAKTYPGVFFDNV
jgi:hypothetical protein